MKKRLTLLFVALLAVAMIFSLAVFAMAEDRVYFEIYTVSPESEGAKPAYTETSSAELSTKLQEYVNSGDTWVVLGADVSLSFNSRYIFKNSLYIDLGGHKLTMTSATSDNTLAPEGGAGQRLEISNGSLTTRGSKVIYPAKASAAPEILFDGVDFDITNDFSDYRAGGSVTFKGCTVNFNSNYQSGVACNRFMFIGQLTGIPSPITVNVIDTVFNASEDFAFSTADGSIFNFGNKFGNTTRLVISGSTFNLLGSSVTKLMSNGTSGAASVEIRDTGIYADCPFLVENSSGATQITVGDDVAITKASLDSSVMKSGNASISYPTGYVMAYLDAGKTFEYVPASEAVSIEYYNGDDKLGERVSKIGTAPAWDVSFGMDYVDGALYSMGGGLFIDKELTQQITEITAETTKLYIAPARGEPYTWAAFSGAPSMDTLVAYSFDRAEIIDAVKNDTVVLIEGYRNITLTHTDKPYTLSRSLTIDARENTLKLGADHTDKAFNPQGGVTLTIKNAKIVSPTARLVYPGAGSFAPVNTNIVLDNVDVDWTNVAMFDYRAGGSFIARNTRFDMSGAVTFAFNLHNNKSGLELDMSFEGCEFIVSGSLSQPFLNLASTASDCTVNIFLDGCSFDIPAGTAMLANSSSSSVLNVTVNGGEASGASYINNAIPFVASLNGGQTSLWLGEDIYFAKDPDIGTFRDVSVTYADGVALARSMDESYPYKLTNDYVSVTVKDGDKSETLRFVKGYSGSLATEKSYNIEVVDGVSYVAESVIAWFDESGNSITTLTPTDGMVLVGKSIPTGKYAAWAIFNADESEIVTHAGEVDGAEGSLPTDVFSGIPENGVLRLYEDLSYTGSSAVQGICPKNGATVDLGGNTLSLYKSRFQTHADSGYTFTVRNGILDAVGSANNVLFANVGAQGSAYIEELQLITKSNIMPFDLRGGRTYIKDCEYEGSANFLAVASRSAENGLIYLEIDGGAYRCQNAININGSVSGNPAPPYTPDIDIVIRNAFFECNYFLSQGGAITESSSLDVSLNGVDVITKSGYFASLTIDNLCSFSLENSRFTSDPRVVIGGYVPDEIVLPLGMGVVERDDGEYSFSISIPVSVRWNLSLYSDFDINIILDGEDIDYVKIDGVEYMPEELELINGSYVFKLRQIPISRAAESFVIEVGYGDGHSVSYTRSVADYASALLLSTHSDNSKRLVVAAMQYVIAAYGYAASMDPEAPAVPAELVSLSQTEEYIQYLPSGDISLGATSDIGNSAVAIYSAQLNLTSHIKFRFNLQPIFSGTLTIADREYTVENGIDKVTGVGYIELDIGAYSFYRDRVSISGRTSLGVEISGEYSLATYMDAVEGDCTAEASALLSSITAYVKMADEYKTELDLVNNFIYKKVGTGYTIIGVKNAKGELVIPEMFEGLYVTAIAPYAFLGESELTGITIPATVKTIGVSAFKDCTSLERITLSEGVEVIGSLAFENTVIKSISVPDSVVAIGMGAFRGCRFVTSIQIPFVGAYESDSNNYFGYIFGAPSYVANSEYVPESLKTVILSNNCARVPAYSFYGCSGIENITLGEGVKHIGISAFSGCKMLKTIYIPATVTEIPAAAYFYNSPFLGCSEELVIVTESEDTSAFGKYWRRVSEELDATLLCGVSYAEYLEMYKNN
ncbi:MAG: leucine-rich repeat domain-containing protein [Clostridia bacterium]|nr:leucine-rich repeat domain-containing protein [Clostridia bacterium]